MKKSPLRTLAIVTLFALGISACGQRGALYLPEPPPPMPKPEGYEQQEPSKNR